MKIKTQEQDAFMKKRAEQNGIAFSLFTLFLSLSFFAAVPAAMKFTNTDVPTLFQNFFRIFACLSTKCYAFFTISDQFFHNMIDLAFLLTF